VIVDALLEEDPELEVLTLPLPLEEDVLPLEAEPVALPLALDDPEVPDDSLAESELDWRVTITPITTPTTARMSTTPMTASFLRCMLAATY
jgi:hypothetical protein